MTMTNSKGPISKFLEAHFLHFNSAVLVDAAKAYIHQLNNNSKMLVSMAGELKNKNAAISRKGSLTSQKYWS